MKVNREELLRRLSAVEAGWSPRPTVEQSDCLVFQDGQVITFNDEVSCRAPSGLDRAIRGAVPAKKLLEILGKFIEDVLDVSQDRGELRLRGKNRAAGVRCEAEIVLPIDALEVPAEDAWQGLPEGFLHALEVVQSCAGSDESQFALTCVHITPDWIEACDNFQLARYTLAMPLARPVLVRKDSLKAILPLGTTEFAETASWLHFRNAEVVVSCRRFLEEYKELTRLLEVEGAPCALPKGLGEAAKRAEVFSSENVDDNHVRVELQSGLVRIEGRSASGWFRETVRCQYTGAALVFTIAPKLLQEILGKHHTCLLSATRLKVDGGPWVYITALGKPPPSTGEGNAPPEEEEMPQRGRRKKATAAVEVAEGEELEEEGDAGEDGE